MSSKNIQTLVIKAKNADSEAFGDLYEMYSYEMYRFAFWYLGDRFLAEDAVGDAAVNAFVSIKKLKDPDKFKSWLFKILRHSCLNQLQKAIAMRKSKEINADVTRGDGISVEEQAELMNALDALQSEDKEILLLSTVGNLSSKEIGKMLSMPPGTVRSRLSRSTDKLYDLLNTVTEKEC